MRRAFPLALLVAATASAQQPGVVVRGTVVGPGDTPLAYAVVSLDSGGSERFTDASGAFFFNGVAAGQVHLRARRLGYRPLDTLVTVAPEMAPVAVRMERLAVALSAIRVTAERRCARGGAPNAASSPELAAIFEQIRENARRYRLVASRYPFVYRAVRSFENTGDYYGSKVTRDTVVMSSASDWQYAPGKVVADVVVLGKRERQMNLPALAQFADEAFIAAHCFSYGGLSTDYGRPLVRVDFRPTIDIDAPDIEGSVFVDPGHDYVIRRLLISLTQPQRATYGVESLDVTTVYRETRPPIIVLDTVVAVTRTGGGGRRGQRVETQTLLEFFFQSGVAPP